jgi:hypothetical protein
MKSRQPSRILNERGLLFGLDYMDVTAMAIVLLIANLSLKPFHKEFFSLPLTGMVLLLLIPIRMRFRKKIIRDFIAYHMGPKVIHALKNRRNKKSQ